MLLLDESEIARLSLSAPVPLTLHPAAVYLSSLASGSQRTMRGSLNAIASLLTGDRCDVMTLDWSKLRYQHTAAIRTALIQKLAPTTVNKMLVALRRVLQEAYRLDLMDANDYFKAADLKNVRADSSPRGRALSLDEIKSLIGNCLKDHSAISIRDAAVISILRGSGIRRQELVSLELADVNIETGEVKIRHGKGNKFRIVYLSDIALELVNRWLEVRGDRAGALICPVNKSGKVTIRHFAEDGDGIYKLVNKRAKKAGIAHF
ncbi:MAG: tyrosine-type recombinase/integrase, partial [Xenococcus sp. (in: cyanobacteria)]